MIRGAIFGMSENVRSSRPVGSGVCLGKDSHSVAVEKKDWSPVGQSSAVNNGIRGGASAALGIALRSSVDRAFRRLDAR